MAELIQQLGHWEELNIEIVDVCYDGVSALNSILMNRPHIVLTDIKMPGYDGIALMEKAKNVGIDAVFIIVSGYKHFEYAQSAIQYGVIDYLLKPIDEGQLNATLKKACQRTRQASDTYQKLRRGWKSDKLWEHIIPRVDAEGVHAYAEESFQGVRTAADCNRIYATQFEPGVFSVCHIKTNMDGMLLESSMFQDKVNEIIYRIGREGLVVEGHICEMGTFLIQNYLKEDEARARQNMSILFYSIKNLEEIYGQLSVTVGYSHGSEDICQLPNLMEQAVAAEAGRLVFGGNRILGYHMIETLPRFDTSQMLTPAYIARLSKCYDFLLTNDLKELFQEIVAEADKFKTCHPMDMLRIQLALVDFSLNRFVSDTGEREKLMRIILLESCSADSFAKLIENTLNKLYAYLEAYIQRQKSKRKKPIDAAKAYMERAYAEPISMESVAERVGVSPAHFSKIFKVETSVGFTEYLAEIRMNAAKKLLAETQKPVSQVAIEVGYPDEKYFSKRFKKLVGLKPSEYRKMYS